MMGKKKIELTCLMRASGEGGNTCEELLIATNLFFSILLFLLEIC